MLLPARMVTSPTMVNVPSMNARTKPRVDTSISTLELLDQSTSSPSNNEHSDAAPEPMAETLDPGEVTIPEEGRGKRRKTANRLYTGNDFESH